MSEIPSAARNDARDDMPAALRVLAHAPAAQPDERDRARLVRARWLVRAVLTAGLVASAYANQLAAQASVESVVIHVWPVLALALSVEIVSRVPAQSRARRRARTVAVATIAAIAAWASYWHMQAAAVRYGERGTSAYLLPFTADGLVVVMTVTLFELTDQLRDRAAAVAQERAALDAMRDDLERARRAERVSRMGQESAAHERDEARGELSALTARMEAMRAAHADALKDARARTARRADTRTTPRGDAPRGPRAADDARRAAWRALRAAHPNESAARLIMRWNVAAHGAAPAVRTAQDWAREDDAARDGMRGAEKSIDAPRADGAR